LLAALSFKIFGLYDWAYRIPAILATVLGAYSCFGLGKLLYNNYVGKIAALIFLTSQTIVLSVIDVRTDAVLTGFTIFSLWHMAAYINKNSLKHIILGAFGAGIAFSTKGTNSPCGYWLTHLMSFSLHAQMDALFKLACIHGYPCFCYNYYTHTIRILPSV